MSSHIIWSLDSDKVQQQVEILGWLPSVAGKNKLTR